MTQPSKEDCKFATEFGGGCIHNFMQLTESIRRCAKCNVLYSPEKDIIRTFTTPDDVYWLIGKLKEKGLSTENFRAWLARNHYTVLVDFMFEFEPAE